jgi:hypothetical protein
MIVTAEAIVPVVVLALLLLIFHNISLKTQPTHIAAADLGSTIEDSKKAEKLIQSLMNLTDK